MIKTLARAIDWPTLLVPIGAALLQSGVRQLERRRLEAEGALAELQELVDLRRAQLAGEHDLDDEPEPAATAAADGGRAVHTIAGAALGLMIAHRLGLLQHAAALVDRYRAARELDDLDQAEPDAEPVPLPADLCNLGEACEHAPDGGNHPVTASGE